MSEPKLRAGMIITDKIAKIMNFDNDWILVEQDTPRQGYWANEGRNTGYEGKPTEHWRCKEVRSGIIIVWTLIIDLVLIIPENWLMVNSPEPREEWLEEVLQ